MESNASRRQQGSILSMEANSQEGEVRGLLGGGSLADALMKVPERFLQKMLSLPILLSPGFQGELSEKRVTEAAKKR